MVQRGEGGTGAAACRQPSPLLAALSKWLRIVCVPPLLPCGRLSESAPPSCCKSPLVRRREKLCAPSRRLRRAPSNPALSIEPRLTDRLSRRSPVYSTVMQSFLCRSLHTFFFPFSHFKLSCNRSKSKM